MASRVVLTNATLSFLASIIVLSGAARVPPPQMREKRMSYHNRLLLNRAVISGLRTVQIVVAVKDGHLSNVRALAKEMDGRVLYTVPAVGYLRVEVPIERVASFAADPGIEAYQITSLSRSSWLRDGQTEAYAANFRTAQNLPVPGAGGPGRQLEFPALAVERSRESGYTGDEDTGIDEWLKAHPTFDGRGITIALMETGQAELTHPAFHSAKTIDGRDIPKLAGILTSISLDEPDDARVELTEIVAAQTAWQRIGDRTYTLPAAGAYRFGFFTLPSTVNLVHRFGVLVNEASGDVWVDTDGDTDFQDEKPVFDVNERVDVRVLRLTHPHPGDVSFVMARARTRGIVYVYVGRSRHETMTMGVAAGMKTDESLAYGVAPAARVLLVRNHEPAGYRLHDWIEGYLLAAERPDVDVLVSSSGVHPGPDTAMDLVGLVFSRMAATYGKPIFHAAGNTQLVTHSVKSFGNTFSVGGSLGVRTFAVLFGGAPLHDLLVHPAGAAGPSIDGMIKPDFLAPMHRISATLASDSRAVQLPRNAPEVQLPPRYALSCCTSATAPYAAGVTALLLSAARQEGIASPLTRLSQVLRVGARFLPHFPSSQQGNGVLDINAAWRELRKPVEVPVIRTSAPIVHPMAQYAARGTEGSGVVEYGGWRVGEHGDRLIQFRRESGGADPTSYRVSWTGNDGTFAAPSTIVLPLNVTVPLPITISVRRAGLHDAILNLHDRATDAIIFRTQATIVAPEAIDPRTLTLRVVGSIGLMRQGAHYFTVPDGFSALTVDLDVKRGGVSVILVPGSGEFPVGFGHVYPQQSRTFKPGRYTVVLPYPRGGTWAIHVGNVSAWREDERGRVSAEEAEYAADIRLLKAELHLRMSRTDMVTIGVENLGAALHEPAIEVAAGTLQTHSGRFLPTGLPAVAEIDVPGDAVTLHVRVRRQLASDAPLELYLYECTTGECFLHDSTVPAAAAATLTVRKPKPGRWIAAVNAAPFPTASGGFVLDEIIGMRGERFTPRSTLLLQTRARRAIPIRLPSVPSATAPAAAVAIAELIDLAVQRNEIERLWETPGMFPPLRQTPAAVGTFVRVMNQH